MTARRQPVADRNARASGGMVIHWVPYSQRSATLAERMGYRLHLLKRAGYRQPWTAMLTYPLLLWRTIMALIRWRPRSVIVIAPPFVAPAAVVVMARLMRARVVVDVHSGALLDRRWRWSVPILAWAARRAGLAVVTLPSLADHLQRRDVHTLVLPDPLPRLPFSSPGDPGDSRPSVVAICGWGSDEPLDELIEAVRSQPWHVSLTGDAPRPLDRLPANVRSTGFLDRHEYGSLLAAADVIVVLTRRDETLLSGAWEALSLGRPLVVSATPALRSAFGPIIASAGATALSIREAVTAALADDTRGQLSRTLAAEFEEASADALEALRRHLGG